MKRVIEVLSRMVEVLLFPSKHDYVLAYSTSSIYGGGCNRGGGGDSTGDTGKVPGPKNSKPNKPKNSKSKLVEALKKLQGAISEALKELREDNDEKK